jgi:hypothetical protein
LEGDNPSMTLADAQQQRLLGRLIEAGDQPVAFAELHAGGIDFPAAVVSELELDGYAIERVYDPGDWSACACSIQNLPTHPTTRARRAGGAGRADRQPRYASRSAQMAQAVLRDLAGRSAPLAPPRTFAPSTARP